MHRVVALALAAMAVGTSLVGPAAAADQPLPATTNRTAAIGVATQTMCPVLPSRKINRRYYYDYQGKRVYFCCPGCPRKFAKEPDKYMKLLAKQGVVLEDTPE